MVLNLLFCLTPVDAVEDSLRLNGASTTACAPKNAKSRVEFGFAKAGAVLPRSLFGCSVKVWTKG